MRTVTGLFAYPVKSMRGVRLDVADLDERGVRHDRAWMVVDRKGNFVSQRELPKMATVLTRVHAAGLLLHAEGVGPLFIGCREWDTGEKILTRVWGDECVTIDQGDDAAAWLRSLFGTDLRLMRMAPSTERPSRRQDADGRVLVGFADGYPLLVCAEESLANLNSRLDEPVTMDRFRANIVVKGCDKPFEEDAWREFSIGGIAFRGMKRCARCAIVMTDQRTGKRDAKEPLFTLAGYRKTGVGVLFGLNANHLGTGVLAVGDKVSVAAYGLPPL